MNRYIIRENIEWEGWNQWTVFAPTEDEAKSLIRLDRLYSNNPLSIQSTRSAKGRKEAGIHKHTSHFEP